MATNPKPRGSIYQGKLNEDKVVPRDYTCVICSKNIAKGELYWYHPLNHEMCHLKCSGVSRDTWVAVRIEYMQNRHLKKQKMPTYGAPWRIACGPWLNVIKPKNESKDAVKSK